MTSLIGLATPTICARVEFAFGADLTAHPESWDWTEMGDYTAEGLTRPRVVRQAIDVTTGRRDEQPVADPAEVAFTLGNADYALTPYNPASTYHPHVKRGVPCRVSVQAGAPHLRLRGVAGSRVSTSDAAALDITGPLACAVEFLAPVTLAPLLFSYTLVGKDGGAGNMSWHFLLTGSTPVVRISSDGTSSSEFSTDLSLSVPSAGPLTVAWEFDDNDGGNTTFTWYAAKGDLDDLLADLAGSQLQDTQVDPGTTSIFSSTAPLEIGDVAGLTADPDNYGAYPGRLGRVQVRSGDLATGTIVADADFSEVAPGATSFNDGFRIWSLSDCEVTDWRPRFTGRAESIKPDWTYVDEDNPVIPTVAHTRVDAAGPLRRLSRLDSPLRSALFRHVTSSGPAGNIGNVLAYWPMEDMSEATKAASGLPGGQVMSLSGDSFRFAADSSLVASQALPAWSSGAGRWLASIPAPAAAITAWFVDWFVYIETPETSPAQTYVQIVGSSGTAVEWRIAVNDTAVGIAADNVAGGSLVATSFSVAAGFFGEWNRVRLNVAQSGGNVAWEVDWTPVATGSGSGTSGSFAGTIGRPTRLRNLFAVPPDGISFGHMVVGAGSLPTDWLAPADSAFVGEPAGTRLLRLCSEEGVLASVEGPYGDDWEMAIMHGSCPMGPQRPGRLVDLLEECAAADTGLLYEDRNGGIAFRSGHALLNQPVRLTLTRDARHVIDPFTPAADDQRYANDITVTRPDGASARYADPGIDTGDEERYEETHDANVETDGQLADHAAWRFRVATWPEMRVPALVSDIAKDADLVDPYLAVAPGDRVQVPDPPPGSPPGPVDQLIDGVTETIERFRWLAALTVAPARPWDVGVIDDDTPTTSLARIDTYGSSLAEDLDTTETAVDVDFIGVRWVTTASEPDQFPFDIVVGGEEMTVTAISGTTSPQTFTVVRSVNGVVKTHSTDDAVELVDPLVLTI